MYGEMTVVLKRREIDESFHGRNSTLRDRHNTSFSAVEHVLASPRGPAVQLYGNVFARNRLDYDSRPACIEVFRVEVTDGAA